MSGWMVKVTGSGETASVRWFAAGESEPKRALILVNDAIKGDPPRDLIETIRQLSPETMQHLGVSAGEVREVPISNP